MMEARAMEQEIVEQVRAGLTAEQKWLPSKYLYDQLGSILFEAICVLPEYYLTRAEERILKENAGQIVASLPAGSWLVELGAGSAVKTQILIDQMLKQWKGLVYCPIDISKEALRTAQANTMSRFPEVSFRGIQGDWFDVLERLAHMEAPARLIAFLGSSIGNMRPDDAVSFFRGLVDRMAPDDRLLLGTDMVKDVDELLPAYDDAAGVTAAFNRNILVRLNRDLQGDFDTRRFRHEARWNEEWKRVEMHLVATMTHTVHLKGLGLDVAFQEGESIHTENSHKFTPELIDRIVEAAGLVVQEYWHDGADRFRVNLLGKDGGDG